MHVLQDLDTVRLWSDRLTEGELISNRNALYKCRKNHVLEEMKKSGSAAMLVLDPNDISYITGARNMTIFAMRTPARYLLVLQDGFTALFEYVGCEHLAAGLPTIDEIRPARGLNRISSGGNAAWSNSAFAREIAGTIRDRDPAIDRIHIDRFPWLAVDALRAEGFELAGSDDILTEARAIKLPIEIPYLRTAMERVNTAVRRLEEHAEPGRTESEVWAEFHHELMAKEGQYVSTRLFQSGSNTYPYFQEAGSRTLARGELLCLDTDAVGYEGYCVDFSRTFLSGDGKASGDQRLLYGRAREQLEHHADILKPGLAFRELAERAWPVPEEHLASRYYCIGHGLGMSGEWPNIPHVDAQSDYPLGGVIEPGMVICLESYVGWEKSAEGVKLEDQFLIHEDRVERMSTYPFDDRLG